MEANQSEKEKRLVAIALQNALSESNRREKDMSSRVFQSIVLQMKECTDRVIGVIDDQGTVVSCNQLTWIGEKWEGAASALNVNESAVVIYGDKTFKPLASRGSHFDYSAFVQGSDEQAKLICSMVTVALNSAKAYYEEKHDKTAFVKSIISDNILLGDIYVRAKELHFASETLRAVFLIRQVGSAEIAAVDVVQNMFADNSEDFVISISESDIAVIKTLNEGGDSKEIYKIAKSIEDTLAQSLKIKTTIGIGTVVGHIRDLARAYKEAGVAIDVGKVFDTEKTIINYENLGIGRLIYQLPTVMCEMFLQEVFKKNPIDALDQETLFTINKFFENNLNVSETARKLFVHRNTLVYRLEKIKKLTGLDLREFDHAIIFKVALMVKKYLVSRENRLI